MIWVSFFVCFVYADLSQSYHIAGIVAKAHERAGAILRAFSSRDIRLLMRAFLVYVRLVVEHNSIIGPLSLFVTLILWNLYSAVSPSAFVVKRALTILTVLNA